MTAPEKDDFDKDSHPQSLPDNKVLHPLFGTYCATETFTAKTKEGSAHTHFEAHLDDPVKKTWTVSKVVTVTKETINPYRPKITTHVHLVKDKMNFRDALKLLGASEKELKDQPAKYKALYPDAPVMGFVHYKAFAEREGYVYDLKGVPHARPNPRTLPLGCTFSQEDVDSANSHVARGEDEFNNNGPASKLPNTHFLLDEFTSAAHHNDFDASLNGARALNILDRFVDNIERVNAKLTEYCEKYSELGYGGLIDEAGELLKTAESGLRQLKAYGVETKEFESFILQCQISCYALHAEGLYDLMNKGKGDFDANEAAFKARVNQALDAFKKIDSSDDGLKTFQNMLVQTPEPKVPSAIGNFVKQYRDERTKYGTATPAPAANKPKTPKP